MVLGVVRRQRQKMNGRWTQDARGRNAEMQRGRENVDRRRKQAQSGFLNEIELGVGSTMVIAIDFAREAVGAVWCRWATDGSGGRDAEKCPWR